MLTFRSLGCSRIVEGRLPKASYGSQPFKRPLSARFSEHPVANFRIIAADPQIRLRGNEG
jgi:hypothetical protein